MSGQPSTVERIAHSGAWHISDIIGGHLVTRVYYFHTRSEALAAWRGEMATEHAR